MRPWFASKHCQGCPDLFRISLLALRAMESSRLYTNDLLFLSLTCHKINNKWEKIKFILHHLYTDNKSQVIQKLLISTGHGILVEWTAISPAD